MVQNVTHLGNIVLYSTGENGQEITHNLNHDKSF